MICTLCAGAPIAALPQPVMISTVNVIYAVYSDSAVDRDAVLRFDTKFCTAADEVFSRFNVKTPPYFNVTICYGGWIFKSLTGLDADIAGIFIASRGILVFQRPEALEKKNIFAVTLRHELLHAAIARTRETRGTDSSRAASCAWLEESLCTAVYPVGDYSISRGKELLSKLGENGVKDFLLKNLLSPDRKKKKDAYALAYVYGMERIRREGETALFETITR
jgi:hypothetical protein